MTAKMRKRGKNPEITDGGMWALPTGESLNNTLGSRLDGEETASYIRWISTERGRQRGGGMENMAKEVLS